MALTALFFAPQAALAAPGGQCGAQTTDGDPNTSDTITCDPTESYPDGISYSSDGGDLRLEEELVAVNRGKELVFMDVQDDGLDVTGTGDDNISFFAEPGNVDSGFIGSGDTRAGITGSGDAVIDYRSEGGDIALTTGPVNATGDALANPADAVAIRAESTAGGDIAIAAGPSAAGRESDLPGGLRSSGTGIFARTTGAGGISIATVAGPSPQDATGITAGGDGIVAGTAGGALSIALGGRIKAGGDAIAASTGGGDIVISAPGRPSRGSGIEAGGAGIEALSGGGDIAISAGGGFRGGVSGATGPAIAAVSGGGAIAIDLRGTIRGDTRAILADSRGGGGALNLDLTAQTSVAPNDVTAPGAAAIEALSGSGPMTIDVGDRTRINGGLRTDAGGDAVLNFAGAVTRTSATIASGVADRPGLDMTARAGTTTVNNERAIRSSGGNPAVGVVSLTEPGNVALRAAGGGDIVVNNDGLILGRIDAAGLSGDFSLVNSTKHGWRLRGDSIFGGDGDVTLENRPESGIYTGIMSITSVNDPFNDALTPQHLAVTTIDFGGGRNTLDNAGQFVVGLGGHIVSFGADRQLPQSEASATTLTGLDRFNNSGDIVLGGLINTAGQAAASFYLTKFILGGGGIEVPMDAVTDDVLSLPGAAFTGSGDSRIWLDAALSRGRPQTGCQTRDADNRLPGADCVDIRGGSTAGHTALVVEDVVPGDQGAFIPGGIVVVDVSDGTSAAEHFTLSPRSLNYSPRFGGVIDKGLFVYPLVYDPAAGQHKLVSLFDQQALQFPLLVQAAQDVGRDATATWAGRQADLHALLRAGRVPDGRLWGRVTGRSTTRDVRQDIGSLARVDNGFQQDSYGVNLGYDRVFGAGGGRAFAAGAGIGYTHSKVDFDETPDRADFDGVNLGLYGSVVAGPLFVDATLNHGWLKMDDEIPSLTLFPVGKSRFQSTFNTGTLPSAANLFSDPDRPVLKTDARVLSARAETGWRFDLTQRLTLTPLAALSWIRADFDGMRLRSHNQQRPGNTVFGKNAPTSLRGGLGGRLDLDTTVAGLTLAYNLTARVWEEFDGETDVAIQNAGPDATVNNDFDGSFTEIATGIDLTSPGGAVDGYLHATGSFGDDYDSVGGELGFRYRW